MSGLAQKFYNAILLAGLPQPELEYRFHLPPPGEVQRKWRFDLAYPNLKIAVEVEGGIWIAGRHTRGAGYKSDCEKYNTAVEQGWKVFRFASGMEEDCVALLRRIFYQHQATRQLS